MGVLKHIRTMICCVFPVNCSNVHSIIKYNVLNGGGPNHQAVTVHIKICSQFLRETLVVEMETKRDLHFTVTLNGHKLETSMLLNLE